MRVREPADVAAASSGAAGAWWDGVSRWLARGDVRAALAVTLGLRLLCSALAAALPLLWPGVYPWRNPFHAALYPPGSPRPVYTPLDYLIQPWDRWDTGWYTEIAQHGYVWFGSTFFPPLFPALIRVAMPLVGGDAVATALLIATVAAFFAFLALYRLAERFAPGGELGAPTLLVAALLPTSFFLMAGYSEALFLALSLWALLAALQEQWGRMALLGALAAITRQQGFLLAALAFPCVWLWARWLWQWLSRVRVATLHPMDTMPPPRWRPLAAAVAPVLAYGAWLGAQRTLLHAPLPWTLLSAPGWDLHFTWPGSGLFADLAALFIHPPTGAHVVMMSIALDAGMSLAAAVALLISVRRLPPGVVLYLAAMWCSGHIKVLPSGLTVSEGRYMLGLLPLCVVPAGWLARGGPARRITWVTIGLLGLMLYLWTFVLGGWVA
jgi:hypothetical protein